MKFREQILFCLLSIALSTCVVAKESRTYSNENTSITLSKNGLRLEKLIVAGMENGFRGNSLWKLYLFDEETKKRNTYPLFGKNIFWQDPWRMGNKSISSNQAKLIDKHWDPAKRLLTLNYLHPQAKVSVYFKINPKSVVWWGEFTNLSDLPVYQFTMVDNWRLSYNQQNTFIVPGVAYEGIEYKTIKRVAYYTVNTWDGFLVTSPGKLLSFYIVQPEDLTFLATGTRLHSKSAPAGELIVSSDTICFRKKGQSLQSVKYKLAEYKDLRAWADNYIKDNFPSIKKLAEKIPEPVRSKLACAYLMPTKNNMKDLSQIMTKIPGTVIFHPTRYMRPVKKEIKTNVLARFPNYFPPNPEYGSMEDYRELVQTVRDNGHLFMPRNSFFFWVKGSDVDIKYDLKKLAKIRIDGKPRTVKWGGPGYLISPSSPIVLELLHDYWETWKKMGTEVLFTNVIGAISPYGNRYDFHPNAPAPDLYYDQIRKMMKWHGDRVPLLSEGGGAWQLPFQVGFCVTKATPHRLKILTECGELLRFRDEIGAMLGHEYVKLYPPNISSTSTDSIPILTYCLLYGVNPKYALLDTKHLNENNYLWMRTNAILGQAVFAPLYGAKLKQFDYPSKGIVRAKYGDLTIIGNYTGKDYNVDVPYPNTRIIPGGFLLYSSDKSTLAGSFSEFAGHLFKKPQLIILKRNAKEIKLYLPLTKNDVLVPVPLNNPQKYKAVLRNEGAETLLQTACGYDCLLVKIPPVPVRLQKNIPYISVSLGKALKSNLSPLSLQAEWRKDNNKLEKEVLIRLENYASVPQKTDIKIHGDVWGKSFSKKLTLMVPGQGRIEKNVALSGKKESDNIDIKISCVSCCPIQTAGNLRLEKNNIPAPMPLNAVKAIAPVVFQWDAVKHKKTPAGFKFASVDATSTPEGWKLSGVKSRMTFWSPELRLNKTIFLECVFRLDKKPVFRNERGEVDLIRPLKEVGSHTRGRGIELRYNFNYDAMRFLTVNNKNILFDLTCFKQHLTEGKWFHIVAWMDGKKQVLTVNGIRVEKNVAGTLQTYSGPWQIGGGFDVTIAFLRIGGK